MIACNNVWHIVELKSIKKIFAAQIWAKVAKIGSETRFFAIFSTFFLNFVFFLSRFLEFAYDDNLQQCIRSSRGKPHKKILEHQIWAKKDQNETWN